MAKSGVVGNLVVNMGINSAQFQAGLASANKNLDAMAKKAADFGKRLSLALGGAAAAVGAFVKMTADSAARTGDQADRFGIAVESLQELRHAADMSGVAVENFDMAFRRFIRRASEAARGTGAAKDAFEELGVRLTDNNRRMRHSEDIFNDVADAMQKIRDPANKLRLAFKIFDTDGAAMVKMFENGSAGIKQFREQARQLGIVLSEDAVRSAQRFNDSLSLIAKVSEGFRNRVFAGIIPAFENLAARILDVSMNSRVMDSVVNVLSGSMNLLARGINFVLDNFHHLVDLFKVFVAAKIISYIAAIGGAMLVMARTIYTAGVAMTLLTSIMRVKITVLAVLAAVIAKATGTYDSLIEKLKEVGQAVISALPEGVRKNVENLGLTLKRLFTDINAANAESARSFGTYLRVSGEAVNSFGKAKEAAKALNDELDRAAKRLLRENETAFEKLNRKLREAQVLFNTGRINAEQYGRAVSRLKNDYSGVTEAAQAAHGAFGSAFADAITGAKSLGEALKGLLNDLSRLLANMVFRSLFGTGRGGDWGILTGMLPGFATGGSFTVGGGGGVDSQLVAFRATPGERVDISTPSQQRSRGGDGVTTINMDLRGADPSVVPRLQAAIDRLAKVVDKQGRAIVSAQHFQSTGVYA